MATMRIKILLYVCAGFGVLYTAHSAGIASPKELYSMATATRKRTAALGMLALYATYSAYYYWCHRSLQVKARNTPAQPSTQHEQTAWIFVPGLADNESSARKYTSHNPHGFMPDNHSVCTFDDCCKNLRELYAQTKQIPWKELATIRQSALAQDHDIATLHSVIKSHHDKNLILFGVSRGASTIINYVALHKPGNIKALILEAPFDDMQSVVHGILKKAYLHWVPGLTTLSNLTCATLFKRYSTCAIAPIDVAAQLPKHIPILLICSEQDKLVPASSTQRLYHALKDAGHAHVELLTTPTGLHSFIITSESAPLYHDNVQNFLKNLN